MTTKRDRITLERIVRLLDDSLSSSPKDYLTHLKLQASVKHARELIEWVRGSGGDDGDQYQSTSRQQAPPRGSLADFDLRISRAERHLADSWELVSATSRPSTPIDGPLDLDFLLPPPPPALPSAASSSSSRKSPPVTSPRQRDFPLDHASSSVEVSEIGKVDQSTFTTQNDNASNSTPLDDFVSPLSSSTRSTIGTDRPSTSRQRPIPPWARNKNKDKSKEPTSLPNASTTATKPTTEDLLPADGPGSVGSSDLLSHHHALQNSLLTDLTSLSTALKTSSQTFSDNLVKDREVMENAEEKLTGNEGKMKGQSERLKGVRGKTRGTTCWTLSVLVVVVAMWVGIFLLIKVT